MVKNVDKGLEARKRSVRLEKGCEGGMRGDKREKWKWESKGTKGPTEIMTGRWEKQGRRDQPKGDICEKLMQK